MGSPLVVLTGDNIVGGTLINTLHGQDGGVVVEIRGEVDVASASRLGQLLTDEEALYRSLHP